MLCMCPYDIHQFLNIEVKLESSLYEAIVMQGSSLES